MTEPKQAIANNITALRQAHSMTQLDLAEKLNYSDKAVSKWERGESVPDVFVLKSIADLFGVTVDYLLQDEHTAQPAPACKMPVCADRNHRVITTLSILIVWLLATLIFVTLDISYPDMGSQWLSFLYALPVSMIVWLVFNSIWMDRRRNYLIISLMMWSILACGYLTLAVMGNHWWQLFLLGIPGQIAIVVWSRFQIRGKM